MGLIEYDIRRISEEVCSYPFTFPSGERGPRVAVNEESTVCTARTIKVPTTIKFS